MRRSIAIPTKVAGRADDSAPKVGVPQAVVHYPSGQWVFRVRDPFRKFDAALGLGCTGRHVELSVICDAGQPTGAHLVTFLLHVSSQEYVRQSRSARIGCVDLWQW